MSSRKRRTGTRKSDEASRLLERLHAALAEAEIQRVLAGSLLALDEQGRARLFEQLDDETAEAIDTRPSKLDAARRAWLKELGGNELQEHTTRFWREHAASLVPDPSHGNYGLCVNWLAAARELDRAAGDRILAQWAAPHRLKRNLWSTVASAGLPVPPGVRKG